MKTHFSAVIENFFSHDTDGVSAYVDDPVGLNCCSEPVSYAAVEEDGTSGLVIGF